MGGGSSARKLAEWRGRLARFRDFEGTVAAFCAAERVSAPSFYQWRRKLAAGSGGGVGGRLGLGAAGSGFAAVRVIGAACVIHATHRQLQFVPH